jgi:type IV pilus assembly protein PilY1
MTTKNEEHSHKEISMKFHFPRDFFRTSAWLAAGALLGLVISAHAAVTDLATAPLASSASTVVKPNISFMLDSSGSMAWTHAPDEAQPFAGALGYPNSHCNTMYYDPSIRYVPAKNADGTDFANASFTSALQDPFQATATTNLSNNFQAFNSTTSFNGGTDTAQAAYYYTYSGSQQPDYQNTAGQFYIECNTPIGVVATATITVAGSSSTSVQNVKVGTTTITSSTSTPTSSSSTASTVASRTASAISANGYTAISNGTVITVYATSTGAIGQTPTVNKASGGMTFTNTAFVAVPFTKVTVSATSGPGGTNELQNFANWYSFYRTRILMMKTGAGRAFASIGPSYRVGFMTIYATPSSSTTDAQYLAINDFTQTQKNSWYSKFYAMDATGGTPLKPAISTAGRNFAGKLGPDPVQYSCQQNFLILTTDGYWNANSANGVRLDGSTAVGNQDNVEASAGSALTVESPTASTATPLPRPLFDGGNANTSNTLADVAAYYYNVDLRNSSLDSGSFHSCVGALGSGTDVCQDNVPATPQDPATWQHMTTFTLGLGTNGQLHYDYNYDTPGNSADFDAIAFGSNNWPVPVGDTLTTIDDLWHAAVNGHGKYFAAKNPNVLVSGISDALAAAHVREAAGSAAATSNLQPVQGDNSVFIASYRTVKWDGDVLARTLNLQTGQLDPGTVWSAQVQLDGQITASSDTRTIFTFLNGAKVNFVPGSFTTTQKANWFTPTTAPILSQSASWTTGQSNNATPDALINWLRGQSGNEDTGNGSASDLFRQRDHVLGDIVDAQPVYVKRNHVFYSDSGYTAFNATQATRQGVVYSAANDGMVHAFDSLTGNEVWAYIPSFVLPNLKALADNAYATQHQYYVDASPNMGDIFTGGGTGTWKTILVGGLGAGGKGFYCLDITNPSSPQVLWEYTDSTMGYSYGTPTIGKLKDGTWVVVLTSGYNNADGVGRLYVLNAATGALRFTISTNVGTAATPSGLSKILGYTINGLLDNTIERIYGGDLLGNVWRFDVNDIIPPSGKDAFLLAQLKVNATTPQPITTTPELGDYKPCGVGNTCNTYNYVFIATGRYLGTSDLSDTTQQSLYGLIDRSGPYPNAPNDMTTGIGDVRNSPNCPIVRQTLSALSTTTRGTSSNTVDPQQNKTCGWYVDFNPGNASPGERVNVDMTLELGILTVATNVPLNSVCTVGGTSWLYYFNYRNGQSLPGATGGVAGKAFSNSLIVGITTVQLGSTAAGNNTGNSTDGSQQCTTSNCVPGSTDTLVITSDGGGGGSTPPPPENPGAGGKRLMWRELLN